MIPPSDLEAMDAKLHKKTQVVLGASITQTLMSVAMVTIGAVVSEQDILFQ